jgi:hypothetical protein
MQPGAVGIYRLRRGRHAFLHCTVRLWGLILAMKKACPVSGNPTFEEAAKDAYLQGFVNATPSGRI